MDNAEVTIDLASLVPVITVAGEIDVATVPLLSRRIEEIPVGCSAVIVDLSALTFIDSLPSGMFDLPTGNKPQAAAKHASY